MSKDIKLSKAQMIQSGASFAWKGYMNKDF